MGHAIDLKRWKRRAHYELFRTYQRPFFSTTVEVDVTRVWADCRRRSGPSFFLTSIFLLQKALNRTEAFRLRLRRRGVWLHDRVAVGTPVLRPDETFGFVRLEPSDRLDEFAAAGQAAVDAAVAGTTVDPMKRTDDIVFHSVLPWLRFTSFTNALPGDDSIPRVVFGRCTAAGRRVTMPLAIEVHHALADGLDVARLVERFSGLCAAGQRKE